jgi:hypothetical protein
MWAGLLCERDLCDEPEGFSDAETLDGDASPCEALRQMATASRRQTWFAYKCDIDVKRMSFCCNPDNDPDDLDIPYDYEAWRSESSNVCFTFKMSCMPQIRCPISRATDITDAPDGFTNPPWYCGGLSPLALYPFKEPTVLCFNDPFSMNKEVKQIVHKSDEWGVEHFLRRMHHSHELDAAPFFRSGNAGQVVLLKLLNMGWRWLCTSIFSYLTHTEKMWLGSGFSEEQAQGRWHAECMGMAKRWRTEFYLSKVVLQHLTFLAEFSKWVCGHLDGKVADLALAASDQAPHHAFAIDRMGSLNVCAIRVAFQEKHWEFTMHPMANLHRQRRFVELMSKLITPSYLYTVLRKQFLNHDDSSEAPLYLELADCLRKEHDVDAWPKVRNVVFYF